MFTAVLSSVFLMAPAAGENWPQWRGPKNDGHSPATGLPAEWGPDKNVVWALPLPGPGSSTPCIWDDSIFLTSMADADVYLLNISTAGREKWRRKLGSGSVRTMRDEGGNIATASCSTDGTLVYAFAGSGKLAAFDFSGKEIWTYDAAQFGDFTDKDVIQFGGHWTPVLFKGRLYVTILHRKGQHLVALDASTGKEIWKAIRTSDSKPGVESRDVYSSPFIWEKGEQALLVVHGNDYCTGHNLSDGSEVWRVTELNPKANYNRAWRAVSSPLVTPDLIVVPSCKHGVTVAIDPTTAKGTIAPGSAAELWRLPKDTPDVPSPLLVDGVVYIMGETGTLYAYDAKTGKKLYDASLTNMRHRANPVSADGKLYFAGREGTVVVVKPGREFEKIAANKLPDTFTGSPAIAGGRLYLRGWKDLYAIGLR